MPTVYLHWNEGGHDEQERRAAYASKEDALAQAAHDLANGHPDVVSICDEDGKVLMNKTAIKKAVKE